MRPRSTCARATNWSSCWRRVLTSGHIDDAERAPLLLEIVQLARATPGRLRAGATGLRGLLSAEVAGQVALRHGIGIRQLRRRADRAIRALTRLVQEDAA